MGGAPYVMNSWYMMQTSSPLGTIWLSEPGPVWDRVGSAGSSRVLPGYCQAIYIGEVRRIHLCFAHLLPAFRHFLCGAGSSLVVRWQPTSSSRRSLLTWLLRYARSTRFLWYTGALRIELPPLQISIGLQACLRVGRLKDKGM